MKIKLPLGVQNASQRLRPGTTPEQRPAEILVPVDFSAASTQALGHAARLAEQNGARLTLLHVACEPRSFRSPDTVRRQRHHLASLAHRLKAVGDQSVPGNVETSVLVCEGAAPAEIIRQAWLRNAGLIVMGRHHHHWSLRPFRARTLARVTEQAGCPVVVVNETAARTGPGGANLPTPGSAAQRTACPA